MTGLNLLQTIFSSQSADYFAQLGGSGRYSNYKEWHSAAIVYLLSSGIEPANYSQVDQLPYSLLPNKLWLETDQLPQKIYARLNQKDYDKNDLHDFSIWISTQIQKSFSDRSELIEWREFLSDFEKYQTL
jgi:hypothetical protein